MMSAHKNVSKKNKSINFRIKLNIIPEQIQPNVCPCQPMFIFPVSFLDDNLPNKTRPKNNILLDLQTALFFESHIKSVTPNSDQKTKLIKP